MLGGTLLVAFNCNFGQNWLKSDRKSKLALRRESHFVVKPLISNHLQFTVG